MSELRTAIQLAMVDHRNHHPIPPITDPMGKHWEQPNRLNIEVDDTHAMMAKEDFDKLHDYTGSQPTGTYTGKMWKVTTRVNGKWWLCWFGKLFNHPQDGPCYENHYREILIV